MLVPMITHINVKDNAIGVGGLRFDFLSGQIGHSFAYVPTTFYLRSCAAQSLSSAGGPATRYLSYFGALPRV